MSVKTMKPQSEDRRVFLKTAGMLPAAPGAWHRRLKSATLVTLRQFHKRR
jgi:hypothetical protein